MYMSGRALAIVILLVASSGALPRAWAEELAPEAGGSTADHSKFKELQKEFASGPEVTEACLSCHTEASKQVMHSIHWTWTFENPSTGQLLGKRNVINSFCGNVASNEPRCTSCHVGYGWTDMREPPPAEEARVDCLVCHDGSGQYAKLATGAGYPSMTTKGETVTGAAARVVDLAKAAQGVAMPRRENCGSCHFYGGGGDNVKHGDLSSALVHPTEAVDVHMAEDGLNFSCEQCHRSTKHVLAGSRYDVKAVDKEGIGKPGITRTDVATCESCHGTTPHDSLTIVGLKLNDHANRVACQTCHIPAFARGGVATKTRWDWSSAGKMDAHGHPMHVDGYTQGDGKLLHTYLATKGDFQYGEDVTPHYAWFNGQVNYTKADETIDPSGVVEINRLSGSADDGQSRIWPFKRMDGRQAYDAGLDRLIYSNVWGPKSDSAYWTNFDWEKAIGAGMKAAGAEFSGKYGFVDTHMYWPITHMVAPAGQALECRECHAAEGRLAHIAGVYMPGSNPRSLGALLGMAVFFAMAAGVTLHMLLRIIARLRKGGSHD
jgi:octaheme c-type cytochrome (tetrathionate reductase family)